MGVLKNWKQLFLSVTYSVFIGAGVRYLFIFIPHLYNHEVPMQHAREKILYPRNYPQEKYWTYEIPTRKNFGPTKYPRENIWTHKTTTRKNMDPRNTHGKNFLNPRNTHEKKFQTHETPTRKIFGPTKARWYDGTRPTRPTIARDRRNLAHSISFRKYKRKLVIYLFNDDSSKPTFFMLNMAFDVLLSTVFVK